MLPRLSRSSVPLLVPLALLSGARQEASPAFHPADGAEWGRAIDSTTRWTLDDVTVRAGGEELDVDPPEVEATATRHLVLRDLRKAATAAAPERCERTLEEVGGRFELALDSPDQHVDAGFERESDLEGERVAFLRGEDGEVSVHWADGEDRDATPLAGLRLEADLQDLLAGGDLAKGETRDLPPAVVRSLLAPSGDLRLLPAGAAGGVPLVLPDGAVVGASLIDPGELSDCAFDGTATITFEDVEETDGHPVAVLVLRLDGTATADRSARFRESADAAGLPAGDYACKLELDLEGEGRLTWDVEAGLPLAFAFHGELSGEVRLGWPEDLGDAALTPLDVELELSGGTDLAYERE